MNKTERMLILQFSFLLILFSSSCSVTQPPVFSDDCSAPCWRKIEPGKTTLEEALAIIDNMTDVDKETIGTASTNRYIFSGYIDFYLKTGENVNIYLLDDVVSAIEFDRPKGIATFGNCIGEFGDPDFVILTNRLGPGGFSFLPTSAMHTWFYALSTKKGVSFSYDTFKSVDQEDTLSSKTKVSTIVYFDPQLFSALYEHNFLVYYDRAVDVSPENFLPWKGYGNIPSLYPDNE